MSSIRLADLAQQLNAELRGDGDIITTGVASTQSMKTGQVTFMVSPKYHEHLAACQVPAVVMTQNDLPFVYSTALVVHSLYLTYARTAQTPDTTLQPTQGIAPSMVIDLLAKLGNNVMIGTNTVIESGVVLGGNMMIDTGCFIGRNTKIGADSRLQVNVAICHEIEIGENCLVQSSTVIGADGFGYADGRGSWVRTPQLNRAVIDDRVKVGAYTTIDCGTLGDTLIGNGIIIDNQCQTAHNAVIGNNTAVANGITMAGSLRIGCYCMTGDASAINSHMEICDKVITTGMGMTMCPISEPGIYSSGISLQPNKAWRKTAALVMNIDEMSKHLKTTEREVNRQD